MGMLLGGAVGRFNPLLTEFRAWHRPVPLAVRAGDGSWFKIVDAVDGGPAQLYLYDEIGGWGVSAGEFVDQLVAVDADRIDLHISSPGGSVFDGLAIFSALYNHPATVDTYIDGLAASAASFIAMAGDTRYMSRNAELMIHDAAGIAFGNAAEMRRMADWLDRASDNIASMYADRAGGTVDGWRTAMQAETWYSAREAKSAGLVDEILGGKPDDPAKIEDRQRWASLFNYAGRAVAPDPVSAVVPAGPPVSEPAIQWADLFHAAFKEA